MRTLLEILLEIYHIPKRLPFNIVSAISIMFSAYVIIWKYIFAFANYLLLQYSQYVLTESEYDELLCDLDLFKTCTQHTLIGLSHPSHCLTKCDWRCFVNSTSAMLPYIRCIYWNVYQHFSLYCCPIWISGESFKSYNKNY